MVNQKVLYESGNELAAYAAKQINYHVMGYYPITPSTQIAEQLDLLKSQGQHDTTLMPAEGEHSAAGICFGASVGGGRVINATSANGLLYAIEQLPVQSGLRFPMVLNVACRTVSGPLDIKGDHSDIMYCLNTGWIILFANSPQMVYDMNICALKIGERVMLPVIVAFDGFFTSHQKRKCMVFEDDAEVKKFLGEYKPQYTALDPKNPVSIGTYMNEPDLINNKFQLHLAMEAARGAIGEVFSEYASLTGRGYGQTEGYRTEDADVVLFLLGSSFHTAKAAADKLREQGKKVGVFTTNVLRPLPTNELFEHCKNAKTIIVGDRQDSYGAGGGNMTLEIKSMLQERGSTARVLSRIYGLGGLDFYVENAEEMFNEGFSGETPKFDYTGKFEGDDTQQYTKYFNPITEEQSKPNNYQCEYDESSKKVIVKGVRVNESTCMPYRLAPGHGACPGCGIPVNVNLLLRGIEGNVVLLFQTGCGMVVMTGYPKTAYRVPFVHNLFQNGAATLAGLVEMYHQRQKRGELPEGEITFIMVSGDGGMDIGMGSALGTALRNNHLIMFEYDNGGYMNTGYQLSYATPKGARSSTSHVGKYQSGKSFFHKDMPMIMAGTHMPYIATVAESNPADFLKKAVKAQYYAKRFGTAYVRALSACPLNWGDKPNDEPKIIEAGVNSCYHPLFEIENGITAITYNPEEKGKKIPVADWLKMMGRTKHLAKEQYAEITSGIQAEIDRRWVRLKAMNDNPLL